MNRSKHWMCKFAQWAHRDGHRTGHWECALLELGCNASVNVPVRGCWPSECIHNPNSKEYRYNPCQCADFQKNNRCPCVDEKGSECWCTCGLRKLEMFIHPNTECRNDGRFDQIGGCPKYVKSTPEEVKAKLKAISYGYYEMLGCINGTKILKWVTEAEEYAGTTCLSKQLKRLIEEIKKHNETKKSKKEKK